MAKNTEIELKLLLTKEALEKMLSLDVVQRALRPGSKKQRRLISSYYDTAELAFKKHGVAYRVRDKGDGTFEATVKTSRHCEGGLSRRMELNIPLTADQAVLTGFKELGLGYDLAELAPCGVEKLFTVDVERTTYILDLKGAVAELAIDYGGIFAKGKSDPIDEVEIELFEGDVEALLAFYQSLKEQVTIREEERSKFVRGLALLGIEADQV